jgi:hypothetical protein
MKTTCCAFLFLLASVCANAQLFPKPAIFTADSLVKGIYLNFSEFQHNSPSLKDDFTSMEEGHPLNSIYNNMIAERLHIRDDNGDFVEFKETHWGICDGKQVFINYKGKYQKVSLDGKYSQFTAKLNGFSLDNPWYYVDYMLDITNNDVIEITVLKVEEILKKENAGLYYEFKKDRKKRMMMYTYVNRLNQKLNEQ